MRPPDSRSLTFRTLRHDWNRSPRLSFVDYDSNRGVISWTTIPIVASFRGLRFQSWLRAWQRHTPFKAQQFSQIRGRKSPLVGRCHQASFHRILFDIADNTLQFVNVPHPMIERLLLPKRSLLGQISVAPCGRETVHALGNPFSRSATTVSEGFDPTGSWPEKPMEMARHDDECIQVAAFLREKSDRIDDDLAQIRSLKNSLGRTPIQPFVNAREIQFPAARIPVVSCQVFRSRLFPQLSSVFGDLQKAFCRNTSE